MMKKLYILTILLYVCNCGFAQSTAASYHFSAFTDTFRTISGVSGVTTNPGYFDCDDCSWGGLNIGFNFVYCGTTYTRLAANSNGYLSLINNTATGYPTYVNDTASMSYSSNYIGGGVGMLMCIWDDNYGYTGTSHAYYVTTGTSPNRVFTFEWNDWGLCCSASSGYDYYQVKLYETSNIIDYWYGRHGITSRTGTIGIANSTRDWQTLNNVSSSPTPSSSRFYTSLSPIPANGQVYRWYPNCLTLAPTATRVCVGDTIQFTGTVTSGTATGYSWAGPLSFSSTNQNPFIASATASMSGIYTFTATTSGCSDSAIVNVTVDTLPAVTISGTTNFCSGGSSYVTINAAPGAVVGYTINGGGVIYDTIGTSGSAAISTGILTTGTSSTNYTYALSSVAMGLCSGTLSGSATITVDPNPSAITGPSTVCLHSTTSLHDADAGGNWTSASTSIATASGTGTTGTIGGVALGTTTITYAFSTGCFTTAPITVIALPTPISGPTSVCIGSNITLTDTGSGTWSSSNAAIATIGSSTGIAGGVSSGQVMITYTTAAGCEITDTLTVNPLPGVISGPTSVCVGSTITVATSSTGGTWSTSSASTATVSSGGVVSGVGAGSVTITYTFGTGCYRTYAVTVNALPANITGSPFLCQSGGTTTLSDATAGGRWTSSNTAIATVGSTSGVVTGGGSGAAIITYTKTATGCYVTDTVRVNPLPKVINGPSDVCAGSRISLTDTITGGTWTSSNTTVATIDNTTGVLSGLSPGTTTVVYYLGTGCTTSTTITVNPVPANITGTFAVCESGGVVSLSDVSTPGTWSTASTGIATVNASTGDVTGVSAGTAVISYSLTATGCYVTANVVVNPLPNDISGPTQVCVGSTITLSDAGGGTWSSNNTTIATVNSSGVVGGVSAGTVLITYASLAGCIKTLSITVNPLPSAITGTASVCQGLVSALSDGGSGSWTTANPSIATVDGSGDVYGVAAGSTTVTYTLPTGCLTTRGFTINPLPDTIAGSPSVCFGYTTNLTDATSGGVWSSGNSAIATVNSSGLVGGASVGGTTITYTLSATGCYSTISMTVNALPSVISGPTNVCVGSAITEIDGTVGSGIWSSSNNTVATIDGSTGVATGRSAGTATITFTAGGGCFVYRTITVDALPATIGGTPVVCEGSTVNLTDASAGGNWSSSNTSLATVTSSGSSTTVSGILAGGLTITYTLPTTCYITTAFTVNTTPVAITGTTDVCEAGSTSRLSDATSGGSWSSGTTSIATVAAATGTVTGVAAGNVTISYTLGACYNTTIVHVRPLPGATITPIGDTALCPGDFVALTANTGTGYTYQWNNSSGPISGETDDYYMVPVGASGRYGVSVTSGYGCFSASVPMSITINLAIASISTTDTSFCSGLSSPILANTGTGLTYQWMRSGTGIAGATSAIYNATSSGNYQVIVTNSSGCDATSAAITMLMLPAPATTLTASSPLTFCLGDSVTLIADTGAGLTYQWQSGGTPISGATNIRFTTNTSGSYQVVETNTNTCSGASAIASVTVLPLPNAAISAAGSTTFCSGGNVVLNTTSAGGGTTYQWYKGGAAIGGATNIAYTASTTGYYVVKVTSPAGCVNMTSTATRVESVSIPIITPFGGTKFCWGASALLGVGVATSASVSYQWQKEAVNISGATNATYIATVSGHYSCIVHVAGGCNTAAYAVTITELPLPNPIIYYDGTYLSTSNYYVNYQWFRNMVPISNGNNSFIPTESGDYTVKVIDSNGCQSISTIYVLRTLGNSRAPLGVNGVNAQDIRIYPNPASDILHVESPQPLSAVIISVDGRKIREVALANDIDISNLAEGIYMIKLFDAEGQMVKVEKFVKK